MRDPEQAEEGTADLAALHRRIHEHADELRREQDGRRLAAGQREHGRKLAAAPVG